MRQRTVNMRTTDRGCAAALSAALRRACSIGPQTSSSVLCHMVSFSYDYVQMCSCTVSRSLCRHNKRRTVNWGTDVRPAQHLTWKHEPQPAGCGAPAPCVRLPSLETITAAVGVKVSSWVAPVMRACLEASISYALAFRVSRR